MEHVGVGLCILHREHVPVVLDKPSCRNRSYTFLVSCHASLSSAFMNATRSSSLWVLCRGCAFFGISKAVLCRRPNVSVDGTSLHEIILDGEASGPMRLGIVSIVSVLQPFSVRIQILLVFWYTLTQFRNYDKVVTFILPISLIMMGCSAELLFSEEKAKGCK